MSIEEAKEAVDSNRLVPPFDASATDPADVYPLHGIIPEVEWKTLSISAFEEANSDKERQALLFFKWSDWINAHVTGKREQTQVTSKGRKKTLYVANCLSVSSMCPESEIGKYYCTYLLCLHSGVSCNRIERLSRKTRCTNQCAVYLVSSSTAYAQDSLRQFVTQQSMYLLHLFPASTPTRVNSHTSTSATETNLLTHVFALCLKVDDFATDTTVLAHDLSMQVSKYVMLSLELYRQA
jgi:DNA-directed RNA polymerase I subunit RPA49